VSVNATFVATLNLSSETAARGASMRVEFDPRQFELQEVEEGGYFRQGNALVNINRQIAPGTGVLEISVVRALAEGVKGTGAIVSLPLRAIAPGAGRIEVKDFTLIPAAEPVPSVQLPPPILVEVK
jgi:hypothetical protein